MLGRGVYLCGLWKIWLGTLLLAGALGGNAPLAAQTGSCVADESTLCLKDGRFEVRAQWQGFDGQTGLGRVADAANSDSGLFYFFDATNWEILVKVLDGCVSNGNFWIFGAATTTVEYTLTVTDTLTGSSVRYFNPLGQASEAIADTTALPVCDAASPRVHRRVDLAEHSPKTRQPAFEASPPPSAPLASEPQSPAKNACAGSPTALCATRERFLVEVGWRNFSDTEGIAQLAPERTDASGIFWFFGADNWEMLIKVLDGCAINGHYWVLGAAATNVAYQIRVTDTVTGEVREYANPLGRRAPAIADTEAFATCGEPDVQLTAEPAAGEPPLAVSFLANASHDVALYSWDFDGDGVVDRTGTRRRENFTFVAPGVHEARVEITTTDGASASDTTTVVVGAAPENQPPSFAGIETALALGPNRVHLTWLPADDDSTPASALRYQIYASAESGFVPNAATLLQVVRGEVEVTLENLTPGAGLEFLVRAVDLEGVANQGRVYRPLTLPSLEVVLDGDELLNAADLNLGPLIDMDEQSLTFSRTDSTVLPTINAVLVGRHDDIAYLRRVVDVTLVDAASGGGEVVVQTAPAALSDSVGQIGIAQSLRLFDVGQAADALTIAPRASSPRPLGLLSSSRVGSALEAEGALRHRRLDWTRSQLAAEQYDYAPLTAKGHEVDLGEVTTDISVDFEPDFDLEVSWGLFSGIESARAIARGELTLEATIEYDFDAAASVSSGQRRLFKRSWYVVYTVGLVPVLQRIDLVVSAEVSASASTEVHASASTFATISAELGVRYNPSTETWETISSTGYDQGMSADLDLAGTVRGEVKVIPRLTVETYGTLAVDLSLEPAVTGTSTARNTFIPRCAPVQLESFDFNLENSCFIEAYFTAFNRRFLDLGRTRICGPAVRPLFSLPEVTLSPEGDGTADDPLHLEARVRDGINNDFRGSSIEWDVDPDIGDFSRITRNPPSARFVCSEDGTARVSFSGHGELGEVARRCFAVEHECELPGLGGRILRVQWRYPNFGSLFESHDLRVGSSVELTAADIIRDFQYSIDIQEEGVILFRFNSDAFFEDTAFNGWHFQDRDGTIRRFTGFVIESTNTRGLSARDLNFNDNAFWVNLDSVVYEAGDFIRLRVLFD